MIRWSLRLPIWIPSKLAVSLRPCASIRNPILDDDINSTVGAIFDLILELDHSLIHSLDALYALSYGVIRFLFKMNMANDTCGS